MTCRLILLCLLGCLLSGLPAQAFDGIDVDRYGVDLASGYRSDQLEWSVAGNRSGGNPNILSELIWEDVEVFQVKAGLWVELKPLPYVARNSLVLVKLSAGKILDGDVRDSDYAGDNRADEWSRSVNKADSGFVFDLSGAWGPKFFIDSVDGLTVTPLLGYGFNMQSLSMTGGEQTVSEPGLAPSRFNPPPPLGHIPGLDSSYTAHWYGPWVGMNADYRISDKFNLGVELGYHVIEFFAQADWNLRQDFDHPVSFEHEADGRGVVVDVSGRYQLSERWSCLLNINIQDWKTESGTDRTYFSDGSIGSSRLNRVEWDSYSIMAGLSYLF